MYVKYCPHLRVRVAAIRDTQAALVRQWRPREVDTCFSSGRSRVLSSLFESELSYCIACLLAGTLAAAFAW